MDKGKKEIGILQRVDNFVRGATNGITLGAADYIAGALDKVTGISQGTYEESINAQLAKTHEVRHEGATAYYSGLLGGGAMLGLVGLSKASGATVAEITTGVGGMYVEAGKATIAPILLRSAEAVTKNTANGAITRAAHTVAETAAVWRATTSPLSHVAGDVANATLILASSGVAGASGAILSDVAKEIESPSYYTGASTKDKDLKGK